MILFQGSVKIKNVSGSDYPVVELGGHVIADQEVVDLMDGALPAHYDDWDAANRAATEGATKLYQDILLGEVELVESTPPLPR